MENIYTKIIKLFEQNRFSVLATLIKQAGSTPRGIGTKFLILEDGSFVGTIGGGRLESQVLGEAEKIFTTNSPVRLKFSLRGEDVADTDMLCGGDVEVFLEPVSPGNLNHLNIFKKVMEISRRGGAGILATVVNDNLWQGGDIPKIFLEQGGMRVGSLGDIRELEDSLLREMDNILNSRQPGIMNYHDEEGNDLELFLEPVMCEPVLFIFGGGHVSTQIVPLACLVGFKVVVIDDRPEFADPGKFPGAFEVNNYPFEDVMDKFDINESSYIVIVTRGHIHDKAVLAQSLKTDAGYIGMIGSRRKRDIIYEKLLEEGFAQDDLGRVHSPIGIHIGAETPEEIAISILAELIQVRAGHHGR
ncbi:MAG: XdhC/CoxI family protein [Thermodesulfobacteriota bacterium]|nr:XdhC/CoxI family protein [Thermodesulfobacteriota bacterium]